MISLSIKIEKLLLTRKIAHAMYKYYSNVFTSPVLKIIIVGRD